MFLDLAEKLAVDHLVTFIWEQTFIQMKMLQLNLNQSRHDIHNLILNQIFIGWSNVPCSKFQNILFRKMQGGIGIPAIRWAGSEGDYNVLVSVQLFSKSSVWNSAENAIYRVGFNALLLSAEFQTELFEDLIWPVILKVHHWWSTESDFLGFGTSWSFTWRFI